MIRPLFVIAVYCSFSLLLLIGMLDPCHTHAMAVTMPDESRRDFSRLVKEKPVEDDPREDQITRITRNLLHSVEMGLATLQRFHTRLQKHVQTAQQDMDAHNGHRFQVLTWDDVRFELRRVWPLAEDREPGSQRRRQIDAYVRSLAPADQAQVQRQREALSAWATEAGRTWLRILEASLKDIQETEKEDEEEEEKDTAAIFQVHRARFDAAKRELDQTFDSLVWLSGPLRRRYEAIRAEAMAPMWDIQQKALVFAAQRAYLDVSHTKGEMVKVWQTAADTILPSPWGVSSWVDALARAVSPIQDAQGYAKSHMRQLARQFADCPCA